MRLKKLTLKGFKIFKNQIEFDFSHSKDINTISGKNGAGKTTIADSLTILQQYIFLDLLKKQYSNNEFTIKASKSCEEKIKSCMSDKEILISVEFEDDNEEIIKIDIEAKTLDSGLDVSILGDKERLQEYWNLESPTDLIMFVESSKYYNESDIKFSELNIETSYILPVERDIWLTLNMVFFPRETFNLLYKRMFKDWAYERLIPTKGKIDLYFKLAEKLLQSIFNNIEFSNFSSNNYKKDEVVRLVTNSNGNIKSKKYDMRNLSSGEKTVFYSFVYINLVSKISVMIIDEPENHLHEDLICKFIDVLRQLSNKDCDYSYALKKIGIGDTLVDKLDKYNRDLQYNKIGQVFLITHSKSLIYSNFNDGSNYIIDNELKILEYEECERKLRDLGLSTLHNRVLFVEGKTEVDLFNKLLKQNIVIEKVENCDRIIQIYKGIKEVDRYINDCKFLFVLDMDESNIKKVQDIINEDTDDFILLERHEIENYLIDIDIWLKASLKLVHENNMGEITREYIESELKYAAKSQTQNFKKQYISYELNNLLTSMVNINHKKIEMDKSEFENYIDTLLNEEIVSQFKEKSLEIYNECNDKFNDTKFLENWINICPGKQVINIAAKKIGEKIGVNKNRLIEEIKSISYKDDKSPLYKLIEDIEYKLK